MVDDRTRPAALLGAAHEQIPEPGAEVGPREQGVGHDAEEQNDGREVRHVTDTSVSTSASMSEMGVGP